MVDTAELSADDMRWLSCAGQFRVYWALVKGSQTGNQVATSVSCSTSRLNAGHHKLGMYSAFVKVHKMQACNFHAEKGLVWSEGQDCRKI